MRTLKTLGLIALAFAGFLAGITLMLLWLVAIGSLVTSL